ncbi:MAG TPA: radical SAM protein [Phycisphaerae bacterium]|nr:radical SAM protein [Phycisphaerae bacterium]
MDLLGQSQPRQLVRYARYTGNLPREVVLLKGLPCIWSRCTFCDYIDDNTTDETTIARVADEQLARVTGEFGRLQVINSGSIQELPLVVREQIRDLLAARKIREFWTESYWSYRKDYAATRAFFGVPTYLFLGVETFDDDLRNRVLNKAMRWKSADEVAAATDAICLMIGIRGQTPDIIRRDIDLLLTKFKCGFINMFSENRLSAGLMDEAIKDWFRSEYGWLEKEPNLTVLWENTGLGVG